MLYSLKTEILEVPPKLVEVVFPADISSRLAAARTTTETTADKYIKYNFRLFILCPSAVIMVNRAYPSRMLSNKLLSLL
jgi:hypothetical protein